MDGRRVYGSPYDTHEQADKERVNKAPQTAPVKKRSEIPTLEEWALTNQQGDYGKRIAGSTYETNEFIRVGHLQGTTLGKTRLHRISRATCQSFADNLTGGPAWVARICAFVSKMLSLAVDDEFIASNPMRGVKKPRVEDRENRTLSPTEALLLLNPATRTDAILLVAMHTGMRRDEIRRLEWRHIREDGVMVPGTKSVKSKGLIPLTPEARAAIEAQPRRSTYVFTTDSGLQLNARNISRDVNIRKKQLGLPPEMRLHDLRGSYISLLIESGVDPRTVMDLARHSDVRTTMKAYARSREVVRREAIEKLRESITINPNPKYNKGHTDDSEVTSG